MSASAKEGEQALALQHFSTSVSEEGALIQKSKDPQSLVLSLMARKVLSSIYRKEANQRSQTQFSPS
jgi:hypothetical protein